MYRHHCAWLAQAKYVATYRLRAFTDFIFAIDASAALIAVINSVSKVTPGWHPSGPARGLKALDQV